MCGDEANGTTNRIREFRGEEDARAIVEVLRESPEAAGWSEQELRELCLLTGVSTYVSERGNFLFGMISGRRILDEAEVLNLAVIQKARRQGEGKRLLMRLLEEFQENGVSRVFLEVRESNSGAISFYARMGFRPVGKRRDYYQNPSESATVMEARLKESTE